MFTNQLERLLLVFFVAVVSACATPQKPPMRIAAAADHVVVRVDGQGAVTGFSEQLSCDAAGEEAFCEAHRVDVATPHLTATPAPGWAFDRWEAQPLDASLADRTVRTYRYTAIFVRARELAARP